MQRFIKVLSVVLGLGILVGCYVVDRSGTEAELARLRAQIADLSKTCKAREATPPATRTIVVERAAPPSAEPPEDEQATASGPLPKTPSLDDLDPDTVAEMGDRAMEARMREKFKREAVDYAWADPYSAAIRDAIDHFRGPDTVLQRVECRTNLCFIELEYANEDAMKSSELTDRVFMDRHAPLREQGGGLLYLNYAKNPKRQTVVVARRGAPPNIFE